MDYYGQDLILIGIIIGAILLSVIVAAILEVFFPKNKLSRIFEKIADWINDNLSLPW